MDGRERKGGMLLSKSSKCAENQAILKEIKKTIKGKILTIHDTCTLSLTHTHTHTTVNKHIQRHK